MNPREAILGIYRAAVDSVDPRWSVISQMQKIDDDTLDFAGNAVAIPEAGVYVIALGKAAVPMAAAAVEIVGDHFRSGIAVTKSEPDIAVSGVEIIQGSHPVADERSIEAGRQLLEFAAGVPGGAIVVALISGGGSALVEAPIGGVTLMQIQEVTRDLLRAGATIDEMNAVRSRLSHIKAGGLLQALDGARVVNLVLSDVLGDDLSIIASGPTVPAREQMPAEDVVSKYGLSLTLPARIDQGVEAPLSLIVGSLEQALQAATEAARELGLNPFVLTSSLQGEAREAGQMLARIAMDAASGKSSISPPVCLLAGGETTVTVRGDGVGGRNTEAALGAAIALQASSGVTMGFLATDGDDAETGAAGAIIDGATIPASDNDEATTALQVNDSYTFLARRGAVVIPGPTGTNVNDLVIAIVEG